MTPKQPYDAVVVGAGPNGLAAAITLARAGRSVVLYEAAEVVGGGMRSAELTQPGFIHDICSAIHPLGLASPFFRALPLHEHGLEWIHPVAPLAHPFDDGTAALLERSIEATAAQLGQDGVNYRRLVGPLVENWEHLGEMVLGPLLRFPRHPVTLARFGLPGLLSARGLARLAFREERARALFAGLAAHSMLPLDAPITSSIGFVLGILGHAVGWPMAKGGSQRIADALAAYFRSLGGEIVTNRRVETMDELPPARTTLFDVTPRQLLQIAGHKFPAGYWRSLRRYRYGPGVFKVDWALHEPIPWKAADCAKAATVHLGATLEEMRVAERAVWRGQHPDTPYVIVVQQTLFDPTRAPAGKHTAWAYCHVPNGSTVDMTTRIEAQIERFAPGFREVVLARHTMNTADYERHNPNYIGGDINGGAQDILQTFIRPVLRLVPYSIPLEGVYICSSSTPPGGGVHGLCGYYAARAALKL